MSKEDLKQFRNNYGIWGESLGIKQIFEIIEQVAATDISVLING